MRTHVVFMNSGKRPARCVNPEGFGDHVGKQAEEKNEWVFDVASALPWEGPETSRVSECALAVANPLGLAVVFVVRTAYINPSPTKMANLCIGGAGDIWDDRVGRNRRQAAIGKLKDLHAKYWTEMETLGAMANG